VILKTDAIVLKTFPYGDSSVITHLYTRSFGIKSFIFRRSKSPGARNKIALFQPLQQIEIIFYQKANRDIQFLSESRLIRYYRYLDQDPVGISFACYLIEIFRSCLKEEEENKKLFDFLQQTLNLMDEHSKGRVQLLVYFLLHFTAYLGFLPDVHASPDDTCFYFDIEAGRVENNSQVFDESSALIYKFLNCAHADCQNIPISSLQKRELLRKIMSYYLYHMEGFKIPGSSDILEDVFRS